MELNKKILLTALSQIKAYRDVIIFQDSSSEGCLDILYSPKTNDPKAYFKMTIRIGGSGADLFDDSPVEKLGKPIPIYLSRIRGVLKDAETCVLENEFVNGIRVAISAADSESPVVRTILNNYDLYLKSIKAEKDVSTVNFRKSEWEYAITETAKFVCHDDTRYFMCGICFDFSKGGEDYVNVVGTDGRKMILIKHAHKHKIITDEDQFTVASEYLFIPSSDYNSVQLQLTKRCGHFAVATEDYRFEGVFECVDGKFPNYLRVLPEINDKTQWFTLCAASFQMTIESVKSLVGKHCIIYLDAQNPESLNITVADGTTTLDVEGTASRPMLLSFSWEHLAPCFFNGMALTKFFLNGSSYAILSHSTKPMRGVSLDVTKVFMPIRQEGIKDGRDEFWIPLKKDEETLNENT